MSRGRGWRSSPQSRVRSAPAEDVVHPEGLEHGSKQDIGHGKGLWFACFFILRADRNLVKIRAGSSVRDVLALENDQGQGEKDRADRHRRRFLAELYRRDLKTTLGREVRRCPTPKRIVKELWMHVLA